MRIRAILSSLPEVVRGEAEDEDDEQYVPTPPKPEDKESQ